MGFVNQFPYSDFHELNLDWLIRQTKETLDKANYLEEEFAKIEVLTEEQINNMIAAAISANNINVYNSINQVRLDLTNAINDLDVSITARYKAYTDAQIALQKIYIDNQDLFYDTLAQGYAATALTEAKAYTDQQVLNYNMMINPINGQYEDVRQVVNDIFDNFLSNDALTAVEYDALELTASAYDAYDLTAYDYDFNGKNLLV